jgi:hypothetical protein
MNNTANLRRIEAGRIADAFPARRVATIIAAAIFSILMISFRPFTPAGGEGTADGGGDIVNQLGFGSLGAVSVLALMTFVDRRVLAAIDKPLVAAAAVLLRPCRWRTGHGPGDGGPVGCLHVDQHPRRARRPGRAAGRGLILGRPAVWRTAG